MSTKSWFPRLLPSRQQHNQMHQQQQPRQRTRPRSRSESAISVEHLPTELLFEVLQHLDYTTIRFILPLVCRALRSFTKECLSPFRLVSHTPIDSIIWREDAVEGGTDHLTWSNTLREVKVHPALRLPWDVSKPCGADGPPDPPLNPLPPYLSALRLSDRNGSSSNVSAASSSVSVASEIDEGCQVWCGVPTPTMPRRHDRRLLATRRFNEHDRFTGWQVGNSVAAELNGRKFKKRIPIQSGIINVAHENATKPAVRTLVLRVGDYHQNKEIVLRGSTHGGVTVGDVDHAIQRIMRKRVRRGWGNNETVGEYLKRRNWTNIWFDGPYIRKDKTVKLVARLYLPPTRYW